MSIINDEYAVYLPAVSETFANNLTKPIPNTRPIPNNFKISDLEFWTKKNPYWHHPHFLHSIGQYKIGTIPDNAITIRGQTDGILFGDSAGFQIGKGTLKGLDTLQAGMSADEACSAWRNSYETRLWILGWLETYTNYAMTIDMPLWVTRPEGKDSPFHLCSHEQLTQLTVENLQFIDSHRQNRTKWLNVVQIEDCESTKKWWKAVKWFPCSGYAIGGRALKSYDLTAILSTLLMMCDDHAFNAERSWIHMLGMSTTRSAIIFTAIQKALRIKATPDLRISYDSASPLLLAGKYEKYVTLPEFGIDVEQWTIKAVACPQSRSYVGSSDLLPFKSPLADTLTLGHLNVNSDMYARNNFDWVTHLMLVHHNVWVYLESMQRANNILFASDRSNAPSIYKECVDLIGHVIGAENWSSELDKHASLFEAFAKS